MIHRTSPIKLTENWQTELSNLITKPKALLELIELDDCYLEAAEKAHRNFPLRTTLSFANKIKKGDINDPLLQQILPIGAELEDIAGYNTDPLNEQTANKIPGLVHKYQGRVLLITAPQCAINCRYCFRRHFDYQGNTPSRAQWQTALDYIKDNKSIDEVILSGGDPLVLNDAQLSWLISAISDIPHVDRLRIHSRVPIVLPSRITPKMLKNVINCRLKTIFVVHCNHPQEIDEHVAHSLINIRECGATLLNQTVLLKGINDNAETLIDLSKSLFAQGVLPYYLHLLDRVSGAAHFDICERDAVALHQSLLNQLPGYLVPKLVREVADAPSKVPVI